MEVLVTITEEQWENLLIQIEKGSDKADILESLLNQGYTFLEAEAIYHKLSQTVVREEKAIAERQSLIKKLNNPPTTILAFSIITGILLPLIYFTISQFPFSILWTFPWMFYVFGNWFFCLAAGNIPGFLGREQGIMAAQCKDSVSSLTQQAIAELGGFAFVTIVGILLIAYMMYIAKTTFSSKKLEEHEKKGKYVSAWFNGTVGFACLTALTYTLQTGVSGELVFDFKRAALALGTNYTSLIATLMIVNYISWAIAIGIIIYFLLRKENN